jgi:hypothetical protein
MTVVPEGVTTEGRAISTTGHVERTDRAEEPVVRRTMSVVADPA